MGYYPRNGWMGDIDHQSNIPMLTQARKYQNLGSGLNGVQLKLFVFKSKKKVYNQNKLITNYSL